VLGAGSGRYVCGEESQPTPFESRVERPFLIKP
jgi:hypothetical protein